jgi:hypothetical protein
MLRALIASTLAILILAAPAGASMHGTGMVRDFTAMGVEFWQHRDVSMCPNPEAGVTPLPEMDAGVQGNGCRFWISSTLVRQAARERWRPHTGGDSVREELCATVFHELGHVAGLGHTTSGLMSPMGGPVPFECVQWVRHRERLERRAYRDRKMHRGRMSG